MYKTRIRMAGLTIEIEHLYPQTKLFGEGMPEDDTKSDFSIAITEEDIENERIKTKEEYAKENLEYEEFSDAALESTAIYRKIAQHLPKYGCIIFHGSAVAYNGKVYIFTAKSGTGKTTHSRLWLKNFKGSYIINGDKPIIRYHNGISYACGTPWNGKERYGNSDIVPIEAICRLTRGEKNEIRESSFKKLAPLFIEQSYRSHDVSVLSQTLKLINDIGRSVKFYELSCNMEDEAAIVAFNKMVKND